MRRGELCRSLHRRLHRQRSITFELEVDAGARLDIVHDGTVEGGSDVVASVWGQADGTGWRGVDDWPLTAFACASGRACGGGAPGFAAARVDGRPSRAAAAAAAVAPPSRAAAAVPERHLAGACATGTAAADTSIPAHGFVSRGAAGNGGTA